MYPLLPITAVLIFLKKKVNPLIFLISSIPGLLVGLYHVYIQSAGVPNSISFLPCTSAIPCEVVDIRLFGFLTIPMLSAVGFFAVTVLVVVAWYLTKKRSN